MVTLWLEFYDFVARNVEFYIHGCSCVVDLWSKYMAPTDFNLGLNLARPGLDCPGLA